MSRQTPLSRRSPSILVTDVRHSKPNSAPFVSRRLNTISVDSLLSNTSEVPSAHRRLIPHRSGSAVPSSHYGSTSHRSPMARNNRRTSELIPVEGLAEGPDLRASPDGSRADGSPGRRSNGADSNASISGSGNGNNAASADGSRNPKNRWGSKKGANPGGAQLPVKPVPQLSKPLLSRTSKQSQRLVLIPDSSESARLGSDLEGRGSGDSSDDTMRVTSYLISEGVMLSKVARYLKTEHRARVRLYDEALFADYLLPLLPGNGIDYRIQSSRGDDRSMERMIDISEQCDHHYEYFAAETDAENDPSEPQDFSPRPNDDAPIRNPRMMGSTNGRQGSPQAGDSSSGYGSTSLNGGSGDGSAGSSDADGRMFQSPPHDEYEGERDLERERERERQHWENKRKLDRYMSHAELFVFNYGVVVFWNFTEAQEKQILADLSIGSEDLIISPFSDQEIQSEELRFTYKLGDSEKPQIFNDLITLNNNSHMLKLAMSHAMAQSTILCGFEDRLQGNLKDVRGVPKTLALTGQLGMNREQLLKISGRLFKLRVDVNLSSNVLDIPEFFWDSEPSLFPLFNALREYLEIEERVLVLNERQSVFLELTSILGDSIAESNMDRITLIVIGLIVLSICVSLTEIAVRFLVLRRHAGKEI